MSRHLTVCRRLRDGLREGRRAFLGGSVALGRWGILSGCGSRNWRSDDESSFSPLRNQNQTKLRITSMRLRGDVFCCCSVRCSGSCFLLGPPLLRPHSPEFLSDSFQLSRKKKNRPQSALPLEQRSSAYVTNLEHLQHAEVRSSSGHG